MAEESPLQIIAIMLLAISAPYLVMGIMIQLDADVQIVVGSGLFTAMGLALWVLWRMGKRK